MFIFENILGRNIVGNCSEKLAKANLYIKDSIGCNYGIHTLMIPTNVVFIIKIPSVNTEMSCVNFAT